MHLFIQYIDINFCSSVHFVLLLFLHFNKAICKQCNEYISKQAMPNQTLVFASGGVEPVPGVSHLQELPEPHLLVSSNKKH